LKAIIVVVVAISLWGCSKSPAPASGPLATVTLTDGSTFSGTVTSSSASAISLQSATGEARTYPMTQVSTVQYANGAAAPPAASLSSQPLASSQLPVSQPPAPQPQAPQPPVSQPPVAERAVPPQPVVEFRTIPSGATIQVRNNETIDSQTAEVGQTYTGVVEHEVVDTEGRVAIPRGASATLVVRGASDQGKLQGRSDLAVDVSSVDVGGRRYRLETTDFVEKGREGVGVNKRTGTFVGGGAALGSIIGAIAGGGKGAAIGALSGAGAGTVTQGVTRGKAVKIPAETMLSFRLEAPVRIRELR
jgi:hypothetical protein